MDNTTCGTGAIGKNTAKANATEAGDCYTDPLQHLGRIQSVGALLAIQASTNVIQYCSANVGQFLNIEPLQLLGQKAEQWLPDYWHQLAQLTSGAGIRFVAGRPFSVALEVVAHTHGDYQYYEFEPVETDGPHWWNYTDRILFLQEMAAAKTPEECRELIVRWVFQRSGYDRVMLYEFLPDLHGKVLKELSRAGDERFLGLHFPASDIPTNAHALYIQSRQRMIADVAGVDVPLLSFQPEAAPLDMTYCMLRAVHPAHIEYLRNMCVQATLSISIVINNALHSLVACHHHQPRTISFLDRIALEEMGRMVSVHLNNLLQLEERSKRANLRQKLAHLEGALSNAGANTRSGLSRHLGMMRDLLAANSAWLHIDEEDFSIGDAPSSEDFKHLEKWLRQGPRDKVFEFAILPEALRDHSTLATLACGVIFLPLNDNNYLVLLCHEQAHNISWAGKPSGMEPNEPLPRSPRHSFDTWSQDVKYTAHEWGTAEIECAAQLRDTLLNYIAISRLEHVALHDPLTGIANRAHFNNNLEIAVADAIHSGNQCALHMLDLDHFKPVNDSLGHAAGDELLQQVAKRLAKLIRHQDTVARLGGDEFAVIQTGLADDTGAIILGEKIITCISQPYLIDGKSIKIGISAGIAMCPHDGNTASDLAQYADFALYKAKRTGKNRVVRYLRGMKM